MRFCSMSMALVAFCSGSLAANSFAELTVTRRPPRDGSGSYTFTCVSEDDGSALVWNDDLHVLPRQRDDEFLPIRPSSNFGCAITDGKTCIANWEKQESWLPVSSIDSPMGPVFDSRWENFAEKSFSPKKDNRKRYDHVTKVPQSGALAFSARGLADVNLKLCEEENLSSSSRCVTITIPAWPHGSLKISSNYEKYPREYIASEGSIVDASVWRTFTLKWDEKFREIHVYSDAGFDYQASFERWVNVKHLFIRSDDAGYLRFHFYDYLRTEAKNTELDSGKIDYSQYSYCMELLVGLCARCQLEVAVVHPNRTTEQIKTISGSWPRHGDLPTWKIVKINATLPDKKDRYFNLKLVTKLNHTAVDGLWAIDSIRQCRSSDDVRTSTITVPGSLTAASRSFPKIGCQRLRYDSHATRDTGVPATDKVANELEVPRLLNITASEAWVKFRGLKNADIDQIQFQLKLKSRRLLVSSGIITSSRVKLSSLSASSTYTVSATATTTRGSKVKLRDLNFTTLCKVRNSTNLKVTPAGNGSVVLNGHSLDKDIIAYEVKIVVQNTRLKDKRPFGETLFVKSLTQRTTQFPLQVYLLTATQYRFYVRAEKACGKSDWVYREYRVGASLGLTVKGGLIVNRTQVSIKLRAPFIVNETNDTVLSVVVKGPPPCGSSPVPDGLRKLLNMTESDQGWLAKEYTARDARPKYWTIGEDTDNDNSKICPLDRYENYVIVVVAIDSVDRVTAILPPIPSMSTETRARTDNESNPQNFKWLLILLILIICFCVIFLWRRKILSAVKQTRQMDFASYSQTLTNWVKSTTTFPPHQPVPEDVEMSSSSSPPQAAPWNRISHSIDVCDFEDYVKESVSNGLLKNQFAMLPKGLIKTHKHGSVGENSVKNRYSDIIPYDDTRVILKKISNDRYSDYINANYVDGFKKKKAYIAAQGPKPQTIVDFWRMVWETESLVICMLANIVEGPKDRERVKCEQYWPEPGDNKTYGDVVVVNENNHVFCDFTFRTFRVTCGQETRMIEHMHYTSWPDHGVPLYPNAVITYLKKLHTLPIGNGPIIVHCSAGIGRTGTIILCDIAFHRAMEKQTIDMLSEFRKIRDCRLNMVDNELQYIFAHVVLVECLVSLPTELPCNGILPLIIEDLKKDLPRHIERLQKTAWEDEALHPPIPSRPAIAEQLAKNRFEELAPNSSNLVYLERYPTRDMHSDYISAVMVDGRSKTKEQYIASQLPLPSTLSDFWRLVAERRVELVIILQRPDLDDPTCCNIISDEELFDPVPFLSVELVKGSDPIKSPRIDELVLSDTSWSATRTQQVTVLTCPEWELGKNGKPPRPEILVDLWKESERVRREKGPTLVLCHDGVTGCGLYLALSFLLERMTVERACDPFFSVRTIRQARSDFVQTREQFEYLYDAAANYIASFERYSNFANNRCK